MKLFLCFVLLCSSGCWSETRQENTRHVEVERHSGMVAGQPTDLVIKRESQETTDSKASGGVDPEAIKAAVSASVSAAMGNYQGAFDKMHAAISAQPTASPYADLIATGTSAMTVLLGGAAYHRNKSARRKEEALRELQDKHDNLVREHVEVCKQLPPDKA